MRSTGKRSAILALECVGGRSSEFIDFHSYLSIVIHIL